MDFPENPYSRRAILVMTEPEYDSLCMDDTSHEILCDDEIAILKYDMDDLYGEGRLHPALAELRDMGLIRPGNVLIQNPFSLDSYKEHETALENFSVVKNFLFLELCQILGAKSITVQQAKISDEKSEAEIDFLASGSIKGVDASAKFSAEYNLLNSLRSKLELNAKFLGGEPQVDRAKNFIVDNNLIGDDNFVNLVRLCGNDCNPLKERFVSINISSEAKRNVKFLSKISAVNFFESKSSFSYNESFLFDIDLKVHVEF